MVWQVHNVPEKGSDTSIKCVPVSNGDYRVQTSTGWEICTLRGATPEGLAHDIETALQLIRDVGFEQGREHVRKALGI